ncbi:MAG: hypothetical protein M1820_001508 [Bogoriella megaspora]|nr:MAG: hypothetical protein M1820_001508 [Bogoriella megaspora]
MSCDIEFEDCVLFNVANSPYTAFSEEPAIAITDVAGRQLVALIHIPQSASAPVDYLKQYVSLGLAEDDVFCLQFLAGIIVFCDRKCGSIDREDLPDSWKTSWVKMIPKDELAHPPPPGPYVMSEGKLRYALRLYDDDANAFSIACRMKRDREIVPLRIGSMCRNHNAVAVPSRLRFQPSDLQPLNGTRITVKDIFDIKGFKTSLGSREYLKMYPPASETATGISALIDAGCQILGLSQMGSMVLKQEPTQSIEFLAPFNPRADGWQSPSGGSSGQACAVASYDWLDISIGSDCE